MFPTRKSLLVTISALAAAALSAPSMAADATKAGTNRGKEDAVLPLSAADADRTITLGLRQHASIQLQANPSTGYSWEVLSAGNVRVDQPIEVVNPSAAPNPVVGAPGIAIVKVHPVRSGRGFLILGYKRPWEHKVEKKIRYNFRILR